jgi:hypothetical protein
MVLTAQTPVHETWAAAAPLKSRLNWIIIVRLAAALVQKWCGYRYYRTMVRQIIQRATTLVPCSFHDIIPCAFDKSSSNLRSQG